MKKIVKIFALTVLMIMGGQAMAQIHGAMFIGASFPMKNFKAFEANSFALAANGEDAGAALGFNTGLKWYFNVGVPGLNVLLSVDGFYNGFNADAKDFYKERQSLLDSFGSNVSLTSPKYINVPAMLGLNYIFHINPQFGIYVEAGAGGNARFITQYSEKYTDLLNVKHNATVDYQTGWSFAYQAGFGIEVARSLVIGCSYYNLGKTPVSAEKTGDILTTPMPNDGSIRPIMVLGRIGFSF